MEVPEMRQPNFDPRAPLLSPGVREALQKSDTNDSLAERIGTRLIYGTWLAGLTAITCSIVVKTVRKVIR